MKINKLLEATLTPYEKMYAAETGARRENLKACGDSKLVLYREICKKNNFPNTLAKIEAEMQSRGLISAPTTNTTASVPISSTPSTATSATLNSNSINFNPDASYFYKNTIETCKFVAADKILNVLKKANYPELALLYLLIAMALGNSILATRIKDLLVTDYNYDVQDIKA
jgi:hypothetical protein